MTLKEIAWLTQNEQIYKSIIQIFVSIEPRIHKLCVMQNIREKIRNIIICYLIQ